MNAIRENTRYRFSDRAKAFLRGFKDFEPLLEIAREGLSGRYGLTEKQSLTYGRRLATAYLDLYSPNRAEIDHVLSNFSRFPAQVQEEAVRYLSANMERLDGIILNAYCEMPSGGSCVYHSWVNTRNGVRKLVSENAHMLGR